MSAPKTSWRCLRGFFWNGDNHAAGAILNLTDDQVRELIWMTGTIEPTATDDRRHIQVVPRVLWESPAETNKRRGQEALEQMRLVGSLKQ